MNDNRKENPMPKYVVLAHNRDGDAADWRIADDWDWARHYALKFKETFELVYVRECSQFTETLSIEPVEVGEMN